MAVRTAVSAVDDSPAVLLAEGHSNGDVKTVVVRTSAAVFLGGATVTSANGLALAVNEILTIELGQGDKLYAICAAAQTANVSCLATRSEPNA
jgi:hypothetical protein